MSKDLYRLDGSSPKRSPSKTDAIGFIALGDDISVIEAELGKPDRHPPGEYTNNVWTLPEGGEVSVGTDGVDPEILALAVVVPDTGRDRFALHKGLVLGVSRLKDFLEAWGRPTSFNIVGGSDDVVSYRMCIQGYVGWVKLDQPARQGRPYSTSLDSKVVTSVVVVHPDETAKKCKHS